MYIRTQRALAVGVSENYLKRKGNNTLYKTNRVMYLEDYLKVFDNTYYC